MAVASPSSPDARRWAIVALVTTAAAIGPAHADDPRDAFGLPRRPAATPTPPRDLFGLDRTPTAPPPGCADATTLPCPRRDGAAPAAIETVLSRAYLRRLPVADSEIGAIAGFALGAARDNAGLAWSGGSSLDNRWLLDGAPIDSPRHGDLDAVVPIDFVSALRIRTAGFSARDRAALGATIDAELREGGPHHRGEVRAWLGAGRSPTAAARARGEYEPFTARYADHRAASAVGLVDGPIARVLGGDAWYVVGVAPSVADQGLERAGFRLADRDGDAAVDRDRDGAIVHESIATQHRDGLAYSVPLLARVGLRTDHHAVGLTALGHVGRTLRWLGVGEAAAVGVDQDARALDLIATWRGRWDATSVRMQGSWHRSARRESAHAAGGDAPAIGYAYVPAPDPAAGDAIDRAIRIACADGPATSDPYLQIPNCRLLRGYYWTGGVGALTDVVQDRPTVTADVEHRRGEHLLGLGVTAEDARVVLTQRYSGGFQRQHLGDDVFIDTRLVQLGGGADDCDGEPCTFVDAVATTYRTRHAAVYLTDTWRPDDDVAVEYGVRAQSTQVGTALVVRDLLPRIGASWDFLGRGRSRLFVGWGQYAQVLPAGTGEALFASPSRLQTVTFAGDASSTIAGGDRGSVRPGTNGTRVDEAVVGVELGVADVVRLGVSLRQRHLGRALEDDLGELATAGRRGGVRATRELTEATAWLENAPTARLGVRFGYAWSRLRGNWPGPYDPVEGYTLSTSSRFDRGPIGEVNATGALPNDQPYRFFAELALRSGWRGFAIDGGLRATAASGRPIDARLGFDQTFAIPRGSAGRLPVIAAANLHLGARRGRFAATLDVFNLFDRRAVTAIDDRYASDARPVSGGDRSDLIWLKDAFDDGPARTNPGYGLPTRHQAPLTVVLGIAAELW